MKYVAQVEVFLFLPTAPIHPPDARASESTGCTMHFVTNYFPMQETMPKGLSLGKIAFIFVVGATIM
jgi:hypothetical protein